MNYRNYYIYLAMINRNYEISKFECNSYFIIAMLLIKLISNYKLSNEFPLNFIYFLYYSNVLMETFLEILNILTNYCHHYFSKIINLITKFLFFYFLCVYSYVRYCLIILTFFLYHEF